MTRLAESTSDIVRKLSGTRALSTGALQISATADQFKTTGTVVFCVDGVIYSYGAADNKEFSSVDDTVEVGYTGVWIVGVTSGGTVSTVFRKYTNAEFALGVAKLPDVAAGVCPFGAIKVVPTSATFTPNTTALTTIGTFYQLSLVPASIAPFV